MALTVVVRSGDAEAPPSITFDAPRIVIGRGDGCEVRLPDTSVSQRHASIRQRGTDYIVIDEGSTNGTFVGPVRLPPRAPRVLRSGDLVRVGRIWLEIRIEQALPTQNAQLATRELALALVANALAAGGERAGVIVTVAAGPDAGRELVVHESDRAYVVGRGDKADLPLTEDDASRKHAEIARRGGQLLVRDLGSKNGTLLGEQPLSGSKAVTWLPGVPLVIGATRLTFDDPVADALRELDRAADEALAHDESVDPPNADSNAPAAPAPPSAESSTSERGPEAPAAVPVRRSTRPGRRSSVATSDLLVAGLALLVLALSVLGLLWLFRLE
jgi:pSer/pThr/pTyr-binding forkhead associated (FHA) protein